jgi:hypothetical protein
MRTIERFLFVETLAFFSAAMVHSELLIQGYLHRRACIAESVIGTVLLGGLLINLVRPLLARRVGLAVQSFALLGTLVGLAMVFMGVGPQTRPDLVFHLALLLLLSAGLSSAYRTS